MTTRTFIMSVAVSTVAGVLALLIVDHIKRRV